MTTLFCNGSPILAGTITAPGTGAWFANIQTAASVAAGDVVVIKDEDGRALVGTAKTGGLAATRTRLHVVGGLGGLGGESTAKHWKNAAVGKILLDICRSLGEVPSPAISASVAASIYQFWSQPGGESGGSALLNLAGSGGWVWRVQKNGTIWIGDPAKASGLNDLTVLEPYPETSSYVVAPDSLALWVGVSQQGSAVQRVEYALSEGTGLRAEYWLA